jgi:hypothetical protein
MDHNEAVRLQAAEKYVLGELPPSTREEYEEHYFDCAECAVDLKAAVAFVDASREILHPEKRQPVEIEQLRRPLLWWLKPWIMVPTMAGLLLLLGYQSFVTVPKIKEQAVSGAAQILFNSYSLRGVNTAGEEGRTLSIQPGEAFLLNFDFVPTRSFTSYIGQLEDGAGHALLRLKISGENANREAHLRVPADLLHAGNYILAFYGDPDASGKINPRNDAGRLPFTVEFRR